jgi:predicted MPP superfamily phosphohydrolase
MIVIILTTILVYSGLNFYIGKRLWDTLLSNIGFLNIKLYWTVFFIIIFSYFIYSALSRYIKNDFVIIKIFNFIGSYWFAVMAYGLIILTFVDIIRFINNKLNIVKLNHINSGYFTVVVIAFIVFLMVYGTINAKNIQLVEYSSYLKNNKNLSKDYNIVLISDIHIGSFITKKQIRESIEMINKENPDIVIIAGDIVDNNIEPFEENGMDEEFKKIKSKFGVYGVLGNHDNFGSDVEKTIKTFKKSNINMLIDDSIIINDEINIIGRNDKSISRNGNGRTDLKSLLKSFDNNKVNILVDHQPIEYDNAKSNNIDLILSGHTHAGQFFPVGIITKRIFKNHWGQKSFSNMDSIVSCGLGTWGPPIRVLTKSEIVSIKFKKSE